MPARWPGTTLRKVTRGAISRACGYASMVIVSQGQIFGQSPHPMQRSRSISTSLNNPGFSAPGTGSMQSTGQTVRQASQPVHPFWLTTAAIFGSRALDGLFGFPTQVFYLNPIVSISSAK